MGGLWEGQVYLVEHNIVFCLGLHGAKVIIGMPVHPEVPAYFLSLALTHTKELVLVFIYA